MNRNLRISLAVIGLALIHTQFPIKTLAWEPQPGSQLAVSALQKHKDGNNEQALSMVSKALEINPNLPEGYYVRGAIYKGMGKWEEARADFNKTLQLFPKFAAAYGDRARIKYEHDKDTKGALEDLSTSLEILKDLNNYSYRADIYSDLHDYDKALADMSLALSMDPTNDELYKHKGELEVFAGKYNAALQDLTSAINLKPKAILYYRRAEAYFYLSKYDSAMHDFQLAANLDKSFAELPNTAMALKLLNENKAAEAAKILPDSNKSLYPIAWYGHALVAMERGRLADATNYLQTALKEAPYNPKALRERARLKFAAKDSKGALEDLAKSLQIYKDPETLLFRSIVYSKQGKNDLALNDLNAALKIDSKNRDVLRYKGYLAYKEGHFLEATTAFSALLETKSEAIDYTLRALAYLADGQYSNALKDCQKANSLEPGRALTHYCLGEAFKATDQFEKALPEFDKVLKENSKDFAALLSRGDVYQSLQKYKEAYTDYSVAAKINPNSIRALISCAIVSLRMGNFELAKPYVDALSKVAPKDPRALAWRSLYYRDIGKYDESIADCDKVLSLLSKEQAGKWTSLHMSTQLLKALALMQIGQYKQSIADANTLVANAGDDLQVKKNAQRTINECERMLKLAETTTDKNEMIKAAGEYIAKGDPKSQLLDGLFKNKLATKRFLFLSNLPEERILYYAKFAEDFLDFVDANYIHLKNAPLTRIYIVSNHQAFLDFVYHHFPEQHEARAAYFPGPNAIVFGDEDGIGVLSHEIMHKILTENATALDKWAEEGLPVFFEQLYGYYDQQKLLLTLGKMNPLRFNMIKADLSTITLSDLLKINDVQNHETSVGLLSFFLNDSNKLKSYLELSRLNGKGGYPTLLEAVYGKNVGELEPSWQEYVKRVEAQKQDVRRLIPAQIFASKADFEEEQKSDFIGGGLSLDQKLASEEKLEVTDGTFRPSF